MGIMLHSLSLNIREFGVQDIKWFREIINYL